MIKRLSPDEAAKYRKLEEYEFDRAIGFTLTPDTDGFELVTYFGDSLHEIIGSTKRPEWIYVLANKHMPGILKIGFTKTSVYQRVNEINAPTGVISPWFPVFTYKTANGYFLEQELHRYMEGLGIRINPSREGFELDVDTAIDIIETIGSKYIIVDVDN